MSQASEEGSTPSESGQAITASFEEARDELAQVVHKLEAGGLSLEDSLALWERGEDLAQACQVWLDQARAKLDAAHQNGSQADGSNPSDE